MAEPKTTNGAANATPAPTGTSAPAERPDRTISEQFTAVVVREFSSVDATVGLTPYQKKLAQHLFIKIDASLKELEQKRLDKNDSSKMPIVWANINMNRLALDAMHRIELGLDALIPGHIYPIPYFNKRLGKYDLDLRVGYTGKDFYRRAMAVDPPEDIIYELVYENDEFVPMKKSVSNLVETYQFEIPKPFDRGNVVGGFAYIAYKDPKKNKLIIVTDAEFKKSESKAQSKDFWGPYPEQMKYKTLVNKATSKLQIDPAKVNAAFSSVEAQDDAVDAQFVAIEIEHEANKGKVLSLAPETQEQQEQTGQTTAAAPEPQADIGNTVTEEAPKAAGRMPGF